MQGSQALRGLAFVVAGWLGLLAVASLQACLPASRVLHSLLAPDVALLTVLYTSLSARSTLEGSVGVAAVLGYLADLVVGAPQGTHMLVFLGLGLSARLFSRLILRGALVTSVVAFVFALVAGLAFVVLRGSLGPTAGWGHLRRIPVEALATALAAPLVFRALRRLERLFVRDSRALSS
jgi:rod shape-determining protein MreD